MTITKKGLLEELDAVWEFQKRHFDDWLKFCDEYRNGKQSTENLSMLVRSLIGRGERNPPWRFLLSQQQLNSLSSGLQKYVETLASIKNWEEHKA